MRSAPRPAARAIPMARLLSDEPTEASVRWVMRTVWLMLALFVAVVVFGHLPKA